jgi:hypothetical protein
MTTLKAMEVANIDFLIERLGQDCGELQFIREFTQNSLDAIRRHGAQEGHVIWDYVRTTDGVRKLTIVDNGCGMTGADMLQYINKLSSGASEQGIAGNFGLGAKIAGAVKNPHGLLYISRVESFDPFYYVVRLMKADGQYGLQLWGNDESGYDHYAAIPVAQLDENEELSRLVHKDLRTWESGTQVIFFGESDSDDTAAGKNGQWVGKAVNTRYFRFPANIRVQSRETKSGSGLRPARGQKWALDNMSQASGIVDLQNARAHWWILHPVDYEPNEPIRDARYAKGINSMQTFQPGYLNKGHVGVIFQDELYNLSTPKTGGYHKLQQFGVFMGMSRVVIYLEPTTKNICANTARTQVLINGSETLPWLDWAAEFQDKMPAAIREYVESVDVKIDTSRDAEFVRNKISEILPLFEMPRYRRDNSGSESVDTTAATGAAGGELISGSGGGSGGGTGHRAGGVKPLLGGLKPGGTRAVRVSVKDIPDIKILRGEPNHLSEDQAAEYIANSNRVHVNGDFRVFRALESHYVGELTPLPENLVIEHVRKVMDRWVMTVVAEVVVGLRAMSSAHWTGTRIDETLENTDSFTMALMPRLLLNHQLNREIKRDLPKPPTRTAEA